MWFSECSACTKLGLSNAPLADPGCVEVSRSEGNLGVSPNCNVAKLSMGTNNFVFDGTDKNVFLPGASAASQSPDRL